MKSLFAAFSLCLVTQLAHAFDPGPHGDGLYAVFTVSGGVSGEFTARLHFDKVPLTVANFVALAEGARPWIDLTNGSIKDTPYYDGIIFHRVSYGFVIQGGSPAGTGSDGPGYSFPDEIDPTLTHTGAGKLSMANSGHNTNGSQFFVTLGSANHLDGLHAVFGEIVDGMDVVNAIGTTPITPVLSATDGKPVTDIVMDSVTIVRVGSAAQAFDVNAWQLPDNGDGEAFLSYENGTLYLEFPRAQTGNYRVYDSTNLSDWDFFGSLSATQGNVEDIKQDVTSLLSSGGKRIFTVAKSLAPPWVDKENAQISVTLTGNIDPDLTLSLAFNAGFLSTYQSDIQSPVTFLYRWFEVGDGVQIETEAILGGTQQAVMWLYLEFETLTTGTVYAILNDAISGNSPNGLDDHFTGTFTYTPAP